MKIVVSKTGMPAATLAYRGSTGETGETEGLLRHLLAQGHDVTYLGMWVGGMVPGVKLVEVKPDVLDCFASYEEQMQVCRAYADRVGGADAFVDMCGSGVGRAWLCDGPPPPDRDWHSRTAQIITTAGLLDCPRICCITDVRCYPGEIDWREPDRKGGAPPLRSLKPVAMLSQITRERRCFAIMSRGTTWLRREVYAGVENWDDLAWQANGDQAEFSVQKPAHARRKGIAVIAHAHIKTGFRKKQRDEAFSKLFTDVDELRAFGLVVHGEGWQHFSNYDSRVMRGKIPMKLIPSLLRRARCGVMLPPEDSSWVTSKVGLYARQGCSPIFYGRGEEFTYDAKWRYMEKTHEFRARDSADLLRISKLPDSRHEEHVHDMRVKTRANFMRLDACLDAIARNEPRDTEQWWRRYGGFRKA